jgi:site-specific DNA recombinase
MPSANGHGSKPERVALYLRVSSEEQRERETIEIQDRFLSEYCRLYRLEVADAYADDGVSGTIPLHERPEGRRLLEDAKAGKFDVLLVYKLDRLGRKLLVIVDAHDRLQAAGVSLRSATEPIDTSNPSGRLIFQMLASFAEYERETIGERTRAGLHRAYRNGKQTGLIPYGYRADESGHLQIVPGEAEIVRQIISNVAAGSTLYAEAQRLSDLGVPTPGWRYKSGRSARKPSGKRWGAPTVRNLVHRRAYSGTHEVKINDGKDIITREVPAIVERALQEQAISRLAENKRYSGGKKRRDYLLRALVVCATCGCACTGQTTTRGQKKYSYYKCSDDRAERSYRGPMHRAPNVSAPWLEDLVWADVKQFVTNPGEVLERVREQLGGEGDDTKELSARRDDLAKRLTAKQSEKDRYVRLYAQEHISDAELETYLSDLKNQISNLRLLIEATEADLALRRERAELADTTYAWLTALGERVEEIEEDTPDAFLKRQQLVRLLVERIIVGKNSSEETTVEITYRFGPPDKPAGGDNGVVVGIQNPSTSSAQNG